MRRFLVGSCCVIVALQVLIGVPLAVCIGFFSLIPHRALGWQTHDGYVEPSTVGYAPSPCTTSCPPAWDSQPSPPMVSAPMAAPLVPNSLVAASQVLSGDTTPQQITDELMATYKQVAEEEAPAPQQDNNLKGISPLPSGVGNSTVEQPRTVADSLRVAAEHLYLLAQNLEADGNYGRADEIRGLARRMREEIFILRREEAPPAGAQISAVEVTTPPTVTEAPPFPSETPAP